MKILVRSQDAKKKRNFKSDAAYLGGEQGDEQNLISETRFSFLGLTRFTESLLAGSSRRRHSSECSSLTIAGNAVCAAVGCGRIVVARLE